MADQAALLKLMAWLSPAFPTGGFSYSQGVEFAIDSGAIADPANLGAWIADLVDHGGGWTDAVLLAEAWHAIETGDRPRLDSATELAAALAPSRERSLETLNQGEAFVRALTAWPSPAIDWLAAIDGGRVALPVAVGAAAAAHGVPLADTLAAYLQAFAGNLVSVGVRLIPLGQSDGLALLAELQPLVSRTAERAARSTLDDLGSAAMISDIAAMRHETQYSRVFQS